MKAIDYKISELIDIDKVIDISKEIFHPSPIEVEKYHNKQDWLKKVQEGGLLVTAYIDNVPAGFVICYPKGKDTLHIWVVGVLEKYRGLKVWSNMYAKIIEWAKNNTYKKLTLNTYEKNFPTMYKFVNNNGFNCYKTEKEAVIEKSYFEKEL